MIKRIKYLMKGIIPLTLVLSLLMTSLVLAETIPTITSDLPDYAPGDTVTLFGAGWQAGESVHIFVVDEIDLTWSRSVDVVAAEDGSFTDTFVLPEWFVAVYSVTATGSSGLTASTSFTDGNVRARPYPSTLSIDIAWKKYNASTSCEVDTANTTGIVTITGTVYRIITGVGAGSKNNPIQQSLLMTAPEVNGYSFKSWTYPGVEYKTPSVCIPGFNGLPQDWQANYVDTTPPVITFNSRTPANLNGWNNDDVTVTWSCSDSGSGAVSDSVSEVVSTEGENQEVTGTCYDRAGNSASDTQSGINIDKTAPIVSLVGGPAAGGSYYFGFVPPAPTCSASDALSGLDGACSVSGYSNLVGDQTVIASATDKAGNTAVSDPVSFTVLPWTLSGFYSPVDMGGVVNIVKGGATVPLKFEVFAGPTELTETSVVNTFVPTRIACEGTLLADTVEVTTTGGTSLRYDAVDGQFIQNWQTPKIPGACYRVTMTTQDGTSLIALFKLK